MLIFYAIIFLFWPVCIKSGTCEILEHKDETKLLKILLKDAFLKHLLALHLKRSAEDDFPTFTTKSSQQEKNFKHFSTNPPIINHISDQHLLVMTFAISLEDFLVKEPEILKAIEEHVQYKTIKCRIADASELSLTNVFVDLYCVYSLSKLIPEHQVVFVPVHKLERLLTSGSMRGFLQKYNVTSFSRKDQRDAMKDTSTDSIRHKIWLPASFGFGTFFFVMIIIMLYCLCCRKRQVRAGEYTGEEQPRLSDHISQHNSITNLSPIKKQNKQNSFSSSPKKCLHSPQKNSTPIFSFTSPSKYKDKVIYSVKSPIETTSPSLVQPQLELLLPIHSPAVSSVSRTSSLTMSSRSSGGSSLDRSSKNLLQSRRGSSASLVIDLSPRSPAQEISPLTDSPTEEILIRKSRLLRFRQLKKAIANDKELVEEYWSMPPNTVSRKESNLRFSFKNRYPDIIPNSKTIVRLKGDDQANVYVNANYIKGPNNASGVYIATQGPLACTLEDFWLMIWQCDCSIIVMITKLKEQNKDKCSQYWPSPYTVAQQTYGRVVVTYDSEIERSGYKILTFYVSHKNFDESRKITHFWFTGWPDHKAPKECSQVLSLVKEVRQLQCTQSGPVVVHCSAGRGRTGCFIALSLGMFQIDEENKVDILKIVSRMRIDRGGMVDKDSQYKFIYKALYEYWSTKRRKSIVSPPMMRKTSSLSTASSSSRSSRSVEIGEELRESDVSLNNSLDDQDIVKQFREFAFHD